MKNWKSIHFFTVFSVILCKFRWLHRKNRIKLYETTTSFYSKKDLKFIKNRFFLVKKWKIQVIVFMIMLTRSSENICNPMCYSGTLGYVRFQPHQSHVIICFFFVHSLRWLNFKITHHSQVLPWFTLYVLVVIGAVIITVPVLFSTGPSLTVNMP